VERSANGRSTNPYNKETKVSKEREVKTIAKMKVNDMLSIKNMLFTG